MFSHVVQERTFKFYSPYTIIPNFTPGNLQALQAFFTKKHGNSHRSKTSLASGFKNWMLFLLWRFCWPKFYKGRICARKAPFISQRLPLKFNIDPQTWWLERWNCRKGIFLQQSWFSGKWPGYLFPSTKVGTFFVRRCYLSRPFPWTKYIKIPHAIKTHNVHFLGVMTWPIFWGPKNPAFFPWVGVLGLSCPLQSLMYGVLSWISSRKKHRDSEGRIGRPSKQDRYGEKGPKNDVFFWGESEKFYSCPLFSPLVGWFYPRKLEFTEVTTLVL